MNKFIARLAPGQVQILGRMLGAILFVVLRDSRRIACRNLQFVNHHWSARRVRRFAREVFRHFGITVVETVQMFCLSRAQCLRRIQVEGADHLHEALEGGRGIIIISAHLGNWESALQFYPLYFNKPMLAVGKRFKIGFVDNWIEKLRSRSGNQMVPKKKVFGQLLRTLRQGETVGMMIDMTRQKQGLPVRFMGHQASATPAAVMLAMRSKSPVLPLFCTREPDGRLILRVAPPVPIRRTGDLRADLQYNLQCMTDIVEQAILQRPEQWFWLQKRWKTYYPDLYDDRLTAGNQMKGEQKG